MTVQRKLVEEQLTQQELESWLWKAAHILRGAVNTSDLSTLRGISKSPSISHASAELSRDLT